MLEKMLQQAVEEGIIVCPEYGNVIEPDAEKCSCGWKNELVLEGLI